MTKRDRAANGIGGESLLQVGEVVAMAVALVGLIFVLVTVRVKRNSSFVSA